MTWIRYTTVFGGNCMSMSTATTFVMWISWSHAWSQNGNNSSNGTLMKWSNSGIIVFEPAFKHAEDISNTNFRQAYCSIFLQRHKCLQWTLHFLSTCTKTTIIVAVVDRFYWNFAVGLQFDVALLTQNFAKIRHICLSYKKVHRGLLFSGHSVYTHTQLF